MSTFRSHAPLLRLVCQGPCTHLGVLDFCLWGPTDAGSIIGNVEGECVAWCTKAGHGKFCSTCHPLFLSFDNGMVTPQFLAISGLICCCLLTVNFNMILIQNFK